MRKLVLFAALGIAFSALAACQSNPELPTVAATPGLVVAPTTPPEIVTLAPPPTTTPDPNNPPPTLVVVTSGVTEAPTRTLDPVQAITNTAIVIDAATAGASINTPEFPVAGTAVVSVTEDPNAPLVFDQIVFVIDVNGVTETVEVYQDGRVIRNGQAATPLNAQQVTDIDTILDEINYFGLSGIFQSTTGRRGTRFTITVVRGEQSMSHIVDDSLTPPELRRLFAVLINAGQTRPR